MFETNAKLHSIFKKIAEDGSIESIQEITRVDLRDLCIAAASINFWLSKHAINILQNGLDGDIPYLEVLTDSDWDTLFNGTYSRDLVLRNIEFMRVEKAIEYTTEAAAETLD